MPELKSKATKASVAAFFQAIKERLGDVDMVVLSQLIRDSLRERRQLAR